MALIKTIAEIKEVLPKLVSNLNNASLLPNFNTVEEKYIVPLIGEALYEELVTKYNANTLSPDQLTLVKHMRLVIAAYGLHDEQAATHVLYTDQGIRTADNGNLPKAVGWEYKELKKYLCDRALDGTEVLLKYMWRKKADLPLWTASDSYKQFEGLLIRTGTDFDNIYKLYQPMRTFFAISRMVKDCQKIYLGTGIGDDLLSHLVKLTEPTEKEKVIIEQLKLALAYFSIHRSGKHYTVRFSDSGFTVVNEIMGGDREGEDSGRSGASVEMIKLSLKAAENDAKDFMLRAKRLAVSHRLSGESTSEFSEAFDKGPLKGYLDPKDRTSVNEKRKIFRF